MRQYQLRGYQPVGPVDVGRGSRGNWPRTRRCSTDDLYDEKYGPPSPHRTERGEPLVDEWADDTPLDWAIYMVDVAGRLRYEAPEPQKSQKSQKSPCAEPEPVPSLAAITNFQAWAAREYTDWLAREFNMKASALVGEAHV